MPNADWRMLANYVNYLGGNVDLHGRLAAPDGVRMIGSSSIPRQICDYFSALMFDPHTEKMVLDDYLPTARTVYAAQQAVTAWYPSAKLFHDRIHHLHRFSTVAVLDRTAFSSAFLAIIGRMSVSIGGTTENAGGAVSVAKSVIEAGEDTALFALFHELGHGVQTESEVPASVKAAILTTHETGKRYGEVFADAFAVIALRAIGRTPQQVRAGAEGALADHGDDADHPDWPTRLASMQSVDPGL